jgi:hypothetical protein
MKEKKFKLFAKIKQILENFSLVTYMKEKNYSNLGGEMDRATFLFFMFVVMQILFAIAEL